MALIGCPVNVGQFGTTDKDLDRYKQAGEYALEAKMYRDDSLTIYNELKSDDIQEKIARAEDAANRAETAEIHVADMTATVEADFNIIDGWVKDMSITPYGFTAVGGEVTVTLPSNFTKVSSIYINGGRQEAGDDFTYNTTTHVVTFAYALQPGDRVSVLAGTVYEQTSTLAQTLQGLGGADYVKTGGGESVQKKLDDISLSSYITPQMFGAAGDGVTDDRDAFYRMFKSGKERIFIPTGTYIIGSKLKCVLDHNINVVCGINTVLKLADNARVNMLVFVGNRSNNFSWVGGEFDGNWDNQGPETLNPNGTFKDMSHGFIVSLFNEVRLDNMYVHSFRGHSMNHGGNKKLHASNLRFNSHIAQAFPQGGSRGDGITGCSEDVLIENVYGFTTDDMVAVFAGILWVEGGTESDSNPVSNLEYLQCKSVTIRNINPWKKLSELDNKTEVYTWNGVVVGGQGGIGVERVHISDVKGYTQYSGVRVGASQPVGSSDVTDYYQTLDGVIIRDIDIRVAGTTNNQHLFNIIRVGELFPSSSGTAHPCLINSLTISNIKCWPTGFNRTLIAVGYTEIKTLDISNITVNGSLKDDTYNMIWCAGDRKISTVNINNVTHNPPETTTDSVAQAQLVLNWTCNYPNYNTKLFANGWPIRRSLSDSAYTSNMLSSDTAVQPEIYGNDVIFRHTSAFSVVPKIKGVHFRDRYLGKVSVGLNGKWSFDEFATIYEPSFYGRPSPQTMIGYSAISWEEGMFVRTVGSPYGEVEGWRYNKDGNWQMVGGFLTNNQVALIDSTTVPTKFAPYTTVKSSIFNDNTWPESVGYVELYTGHPSGRAGAYELVHGGVSIRRRTWNTNTSSWNAWISVALA